MTGFVKRGLPYASNSMNSMDCSLGFKVHTNLKFLYLLTYVGTHWCPTFNAMAVFNLKLWIVNVGKLDVCGRSLFTNPVTFMQCTKLPYVTINVEIWLLVWFQCTRSKICRHNQQVLTNVPINYPHDNFCE